MRGKDNKGFWDRWAKQYDFMMAMDGKTYGGVLKLTYAEARVKQKQF